MCQFNKLDGSQLNFVLRFVKMVNFFPYFSKQILDLVLARFT